MDLSACRDFGFPFDLLFDSALVGVFAAAKFYPVRFPRLPLDFELC